MRRVLWEIGPVSINTFGVMIALGFLAALWVLRREVRRKGLGEGLAEDFALWAMVGGLLGARLGYILIYNLPYYLNNPAEVFAIHQGGMSIHGSLVGGILAAVLFVRRRGLSFWRLADMVAPGLALGQAIGRVGCDVFGKPMAQPFFWGVEVNGLLLHPVQVYEFLLNYLMFYLLWHQRKQVGYDGQLLVRYLVYYGIIRFGVELFRFNPVIWGPFTVAHAMSLVAILAGWLLYRHLSRPAVSTKPGLEAACTTEAASPWLEGALVVAMMALSLLLFYGVR